MADDDPYRYFRIEAAELSERLAHGALQIAKGGLPSEGVPALLRHAHTLKGAARVVKRVTIAERCHAIEDVLAPFRSANGEIPRSVGEALLASLDTISAELRMLPEATSAAHAAPARAAEARAREPLVQVMRADGAEVESVIKGLTETLVELEGVGESIGVLDNSRRLLEQLEQQLRPRRTEATRAALDGARAVAAELGREVRRLDRSLRQGLGRLRRELVEVHAGAERLRLIPAASMFDALERTVHDAAEELGKGVTFVAHGGNVRLEARLLGLARSALSHVVRNAVVHGIEAEAARRAAGKPPAGTVRVSIERKGQHVSFTCADDGAGLDIAGLRSALAARGEAERGLTDEAVIARVLEAGVSTSSAVTGLAGRGVGLDVLRTVAAELGGTAELENHPGVGLVVRLRAPLSETAITAIATNTGGRTVALPLEAVIETVRYIPSDITRSGSRSSVCHHGEMIPFLPLATVLGETEPARTGPWSALIVKGLTGRVAVGVDRLLGARQIVVRPLPEEARAARFIAGASLDALGKPEIVLDPDALVDAVRGTGTERAAPRPERAPILIVDDSLTTRMLEQSILEAAGYEVELATSGEEGLAKAKSRAYSLFLVDVEMPGIDGFTFVDRTRKDPELGRVPAVLVSSRAAPEDFERGKAVGARGYIVKERFDQRQLLGLIQNLVGGA